MKELKSLRYNIWIEGYVVMEGRGEAEQIASGIEGSSFRGACIKFSQTEEAKGWGKFDEENLSFWGCKLYDNYEEAKKFCG